MKRTFREIEQCKDRVGTMIHPGDKVVHIHTSRYGGVDFVKATITKMGMFLSAGEMLSPVRLYLNKEDGVQSVVYTDSVIAIKQGE